ncbi:hypothetical protein cypCar_00000113 [Cyprinus carpio]|nr:hypothetical protein cypCar_00000113 [Cyprinus carpio]
MILLTPTSVSNLGKVWDGWHKTETM